MVVKTRTFTYEAAGAVVEVSIGEISATEGYKVTILEIGFVIDAATLGRIDGYLDEEQVDIAVDYENHPAPTQRVVVNRELLPGMKHTWKATGTVAGTYSVFVVYDKTKK